MLIELLFDLRISQASGCFLGTRGPSRGLAVAGGSGFGKLSSRGGGRGFCSRARCVSSCTFDAVDVGFFFFFFFLENCLVAALELTKALPSPSCLTLGEGWGRQELFQEVSDHLP